MRHFFLLPPLILVLVGPGFAAAAHADSNTYLYSFQLGFATITNLLLTDSVALAPTDNEGHNPQNGDGLQHAVSINDGKPILLVWRKADNWTAATDGYFTWVNGPNGLQKRLNTERFSFEANLDKLATASAIPLASATGGGITAAAYAALVSQYKQAHPAFQRHVLGDMNTMLTEPPTGGEPLPNIDRYKPENRLATENWLLQNMPWFNVNGHVAGKLLDISQSSKSVIVTIAFDQTNPTKTTQVIFSFDTPSANMGIVAEASDVQQTPFLQTSDPATFALAVAYYTGGIGSYVFADVQDVSAYNTRHNLNLTGTVAF